MAVHHYAVDDFMINIPVARSALFFVHQPAINLTELKKGMICQ